MDTLKDHITFLPSPGNNKRVETGPVQFGEDWPGLFMRGDCCIGYLMGLETFLRNPNDALARLQVEGLAKLLSSCIMRGEDFPFPPNPYTPTDKIKESVALLTNIRSAIVNLQPGPMRILINPEECSHPDIKRTIFFRAIDEFDHTGWACQTCGKEFDNPPIKIVESF